ncbi:MAG: cation:proton antiporter [Gammaproteobacteria bacterium]
METLWIVLILLIATRVCGSVASRFGQPVLVGELLAGIVLGIVAGQLDRQIFSFELSSDHHLMALSDLGIFFLMLLGGFELRPRDLVESSYRGLIIAVTAMLVPWLSGFYVGWLWLPESDLRFAQSLFVGTALAITAVPVTIRMFMDIGMLQSNIGKLVVSAAVFDDFLSLILLSILVAIINTGQLPDYSILSLILLKVLLFLVVTFLLGKYLMPLLARYAASIKVEEMIFSFLLLAGAVFAVLAEFLGLHFILGAFAAGLFFGKHTISKKVYKDLHRKLSAITTGFLAPIFFASIGIELNLSALIEIPVFLVLLLSLAFLGKLLGAAIPARLLGFRSRDGWAIGLGMNARGAVGLIIAGIALDSGLFITKGVPSPVVENLFSAIVIVVILTTIVAPIGVKWVLSKDVQKA